MNYGNHQELMDLRWENIMLKNAIVKHFLGVDLENRPSNRITLAKEENHEDFKQKIEDAFGDKGEIK